MTGLGKLVRPSGGVARVSIILWMQERGKEDDFGAPNFPGNKSLPLNDL